MNRRHSVSYVLQLILIFFLNFRLLEVRGDQLTHLEMRNIDELNLNAVLLVTMIKSPQTSCTIDF